MSGWFFREVQLLDIISQSSFSDIRQRQAILIEKLQDEVLNEQEHRELLALNDAMEAADVERLRALIELAGIRGVIVDVLVKELSC